MTHFNNKNVPMKEMSFHIQKQSLQLNMSNWELHILNITNKAFGLLGCYERYVGMFMNVSGQPISPIFQCQYRTDRLPTLLADNYQHMLRNIQDKLRPRLHCGKASTHIMNMYRYSYWCTGVREHTWVSRNKASHMMLAQYFKSGHSACFYVVSKSLLINHPTLHAIQPKFATGTSTHSLTLIVLMWRIGWAHNNPRK